MFPSPYLTHILDQAHEADLLKQMAPWPRSERQVVKDGRAALIRLLKR